MSTQSTIDEGLIKPTDLRGILKYVPMFREQVFVIALDGSLVAHENFQNVLLDIAVLRSLNIKVVLVHGIGQQLLHLSQDRNLPIANRHGEGPTDRQTLALATEAAGSVSLKISQGLTRNGLRCASCNGVRAKAIGIVKGVDQLFGGNVDKLDTTLFTRLLDGHTIPIVSPIAFDRTGHPLRINSDLLAAELACKLQASKLIFMTTETGLTISDQAIKNLPVAELEECLANEGGSIPDRLLSKAKHAVHAIHAGTPRAHILDGRLFGALLNEVFDKVGIGTMVYSNEYQSIRPAVKADAYSIYNITRNAVRTESLCDRSQATIDKEISNYLVYEIDGSIVGCIHLRYYNDEAIIEIGSVYVQPFYQGKGVGKRLVKYAVQQAQDNNAERVFALTTQASDFFQHVCAFSEGRIEDLPSPRQQESRANGRNSKVFLYNLR